MASTSRKTRSATKKNTKNVETVANNRDIFRLPENKVVFSYECNKAKQDENASRVLRLVKQAHDILFKGDKISGLDAMQDIVNLLFLTMISKKLSSQPEEGKIDLWNKDKYPTFRSVVLDSLVKEGLVVNDDLNLLAVNDIVCDLTLLHHDPKQVDLFKRIGQLLTTHPDTIKMFPSHILFNMKHATTLRDLVNCLVAKVDVETLHECEDLIGDIYEYFMSAYQGKGANSQSKKLGQYFTPRKLMKLIIGYLHSNNTFTDFLDIPNVKVVDRCMGTAGWLVSFYNMMKTEFKGNIELRGCEFNDETARLAMMNLINVSGKVPKMETKDSLIDVESDKYHIGLYNPPFGSDEKYDNLEKKYKQNSNNPPIQDVYKMKSNKGPFQFIDTAIYTLEDDGLCIIVLPYGEIFYGDNCRKEREYLINTIGITHIFLIPSGVFTHTGIKTCVMVFRKGQQTRSVDFLRVNQDCNEITKVTTISFDDIQKEGSFSLYHADYLKDVYVEELKTKVKTRYVRFGDLFRLANSQSQSTEVDEVEDGMYPFITKTRDSSQWKLLDTYTNDGQNLFVFLTSNTTQLGVTYYEGKCSFSNLLSQLVLNEQYSSCINLKFIYYHLVASRFNIDKLYLKGACNQSVDFKNLNRMEVPIPPISIQNALVREMDSSYAKIYHLKEIKQICEQNDIPTCFNWSLDIAIANDEVEWVEFGDAITLKKGSIQSSTIIESVDGKGKFVTQSKDQNSWPPIDEDTCDFDGECLFIGNTSSGGKVPIRYYHGICSCSNLLSCMIPYEQYHKKINMRYLYYYLSSINEHLNATKQKGACNLGLDIKNFNRMPLPLLPIDIQNKIVDECQKIETFVGDLQNQIDNITCNITNKFLDKLMLMKQ